MGSLQGNVSSAVYRSESSHAFATNGQGPLDLESVSKASAPSYKTATDYPEARTGDMVASLVDEDAYACNASVAPSSRSAYSVGSGPSVYSSPSNQALPMQMLHPSVPSIGQYNVVYAPQQVPPQHTQNWFVVPSTHTPGYQPPPLQGSYGYPQPQQLHQLPMHPHHQLQQQHSHHNPFHANQHFSTGSPFHNQAHSQNQRAGGYLHKGNSHNRNVLYHHEVPRTEKNVKPGVASGTASDSLPFVVEGFAFPGGLNRKERRRILFLKEIDSSACQGAVRIPDEWARKNTLTPEAKKGSDDGKRCSDENHPQMKPFWNITHEDYAEIKRLAER